MAETTPVFICQPKGKHCGKAGRNFVRIKEGSQALERGPSDARWVDTKRGRNFPITRL
jgi:hypothetical protein